MLASCPPPSQVSLAHNDVSMLERLLDSSTRFSLGPRQLRDLACVAAAAGADTDMLTGAASYQISCRGEFGALVAAAAAAASLCAQPSMFHLSPAMHGLRSLVIHIVVWPTCLRLNPYASFCQHGTLTFLHLLLPPPCCPPPLPQLCWIYAPYVS